jgi:hypothetical protein
MPCMATMNSFERTPPTLSVYAPTARAIETERATDSQQSECCCPEFCQLDHAN